MNGKRDRAIDVLFDWASERGRVAELEALGIEALSSFGLHTLRPAADRVEIQKWEARHGFRLPAGLRAWLERSNGFYSQGPLIHPISAIGPMIPFGRFSELVLQPESWFELGNPRTEPICIDLAYRWPGGDHPLFTSGDKARESAPKLVAPSFEEWFLSVLRSGGGEYWFDPGFRTLGDPWLEHRRRAPAPRLPVRLADAAAKVRPILHTKYDERGLAADLGVSRGDLEAIVRHLQHLEPLVNVTDAEGLLGSKHDR